MGEQGPPGPSSGGDTYVRWGRTTCPDTNGTVYAGRATGPFYSQIGGTNDYLCLPEEPQYLEYEPGVRESSVLHGAGCVAWSNQPLECVLMIPAHISCPNTWTLEYRVSDDSTQRPYQNLCFMY